MIRQPEFVNEELIQWATTELMRKKPELTTKKARFEVFEEGLCVQIMHVGPLFYRAGDNEESGGLSFRAWTEEPAVKWGQASRDLPLRPEKS